jgi:predicted Zn-dependent protease
MRRRHLLFAFPLSAMVHAQNRNLPLASPVDAVHVYIIPTDDVSEQAAGQLARALTLATGLWIKASLWTPAGGIEPFSGTNQYAAEDYLAFAAKAAKMLHEVSPRTYFIAMTDRDINSKDRNLRFAFATHSPMTNSSVLSLARLQYNGDGSQATQDVVSERMAKMLLRIIGEMRLGWKRSSDPADLMYAPIMSIDDIDRMNLADTLRQRKQRQ